MSGLTDEGALAWRARSPLARRRIGAGSEVRVRTPLARHLSLYNNRVPEAKALLLDATNLPAKDFAIIAAKVPPKYSPSASTRMAA